MKNVMYMKTVTNIWDWPALRPWFLLLGVELESLSDVALRPRKWITRIHAMMVPVSSVEMRARRRRVEERIPWNVNAHLDGFALEDGDGGVVGVEDDGAGGCERSVALVLGRRRDDGCVASKVL